jgi:hypothetical protein
VRFGDEAAGDRKPPWRTRQGAMQASREHYGPATWGQWPTAARDQSEDGSEALALGQYEATFRENEIDPDVLPDLTELDLEKLGIPLGHRKRLFKAIAKLDTQEGESPSKPIPAAPTAAQIGHRLTPEANTLRSGLRFSLRIAAIGKSIAA